MKKLIAGLLALTSMTANIAYAETYVYTGNKYTNVNAPYTTDMQVSASITTSAPIPPNSFDFDISDITISWSFFDGVHTITDADGVFHPYSIFAPKFTTDVAGNIIHANVFASIAPVASEVNQTSQYIATFASDNVFDHGVQLAKCTAVTNLGDMDNPEFVCIAYLFGPRGYVDNNAGTWTMAVPDREHTDKLPSGKLGSISFTTDDPNCTFAEDPQFLSIEDVKPLPPDEVVPIDGLVQFSIESCADGATVTISVDYVVDLPADAEYWKVGDPWFKLESTTLGSVITFVITDGKIGDDDGESNGRIVDPGGASIADIFSDGFESE